MAAVLSNYVVTGMQPALTKQHFSPDSLLEAVRFTALNLVH